MTPTHWLGIVLVAGSVLAMLRLIVAHLRAPAEARPAAWRTLALLALTAVSTFLLHHTLAPPPVPVAPGTMVVLTAGAEGLARPQAAHVAALPEAGAVPEGATRMPDLATALRRYPDARALVIVGHGLQPRDRDAVDGRALSVVQPTLPRGIVELVAPEPLGPGAQFEVRGRVADVASAHVTLTDPAGRVVAAARTDDTGHFALAATARGAGATAFDVAVLDADEAMVDRVQVPVVVDEDAAPRVLLLAGSPNPDLRALRRWAEDVGLPLRWRASVGAGAAVGDAPALDAASLAGQDLLLLDARAFDALGPAARASLSAAVRDGLGVLVHAPQPPAAALRAWLRSADLAVETGRARAWQPDGGPADVAQLRAWLGPGSDDAPFDPLLAGETPPALSYLPLTGGIAGEGAAPGDMMRWQALGRGRIGVVTLADSWQLPPAGRADLHAALWSGWAGTLARTGARRAPRLDGDARVGTRLAVCGLDPDARIRAPDGRVITPVADPGADGCAGVWPTVAGWHRIEQAAGSWPLLVRARDEASGLQAAALQTATRALVRDVDTGATSSAATRPGNPWPWALAWLCVTAALWALGRARVGRPTLSGDPRIA